MLWNCTPEQRRAAVQKGIETKRRNAAKREAEWQEASAKAMRCAEIEQRLKDLDRMEALTDSAIAICGKAMATEQEIVRAAMSGAGRVCGVYFLVANGRVVYVGQSVNVHGRVAEHGREKTFDAFAYVPCAPESLNVLESLYIHTLRPPLNGDAPNGGKCAPLSLRQIIEG